MSWRLAERSPAGPSRSRTWAQTANPARSTSQGDLVLDATSGAITFDNTDWTLLMLRANHHCGGRRRGARQPHDDRRQHFDQCRRQHRHRHDQRRKWQRLDHIRFWSRFQATMGQRLCRLPPALLGLQSSAQSTTSSAQSASSAASAAQAASVQDQLNAAEAAATAEAAAAVVSADQTTAAAFQSAMNSMQAAVTIDNQTYQADVQITNQDIKRPMTNRM